MDATNASMICRDYFESVHGLYSTLGFQTTNVKTIDEDWHVECQMYPMPSARDPITYLVVINDCDGAILSVRRA